MSIEIAISLILLALIFGVLAGVMIYSYHYKTKIKKTGDEAEKMLKDAEAKATAVMEKADKTAEQLRLNAERELKEGRATIQQLQNKIDVREQNLDRRDLALLHKEEALEAKYQNLNQKVQELEKKEKDLSIRAEGIEAELARVGGLTLSQAKEELMITLEKKMAREMGAYIATREEELHSQEKELSQRIISTAIAKYSQEVTIERTVSVVSLPSDELKGRIIGREGRNIKTLEQLTGVDLIIDDTPEVITVSCFNPLRREVARRSLDTLIKDGRIQPGRIEEVVEKTKQELAENIIKIGEETIFELGITKMHKEIVEIIGRLQYRTSYGQNVLQHSKEVAHLAGIMAAELGLNQTLARRAGLLHDIGKAIDFEQEGSHVELGVRIAKKHQEHPIVINAIESHHGDAPATHPISVLVAAADALSAARPGARSETLENYIKRVEMLEEIALSFEGVSQAFAIQAGREIRIMVAPEKINDMEIVKIAHDIREKIENDLSYPGQIKVTVIREVRANDLAK